VLFLNILVLSAILFLSGCSSSDEEGGWLSSLFGPSSKHAVFVELDHPVKSKDVLPLSPHVAVARARPSQEMIQNSHGTPLEFHVLDKRTLRVYALTVSVGKRIKGPWQGSLECVAYVRDLQIAEGRAVHGIEGHVNPAAWVEVRDEHAQRLFEGWLFTRDPAQTAWDHERFDMTFLGPVMEGVANGIRTAPVR
jgi:hypothetical protein